MDQNQSIKRRLSLVPIEAIEACAAAFEDGAQKYGRNSFKHLKDAKWSDCLDSLLRHAHAFNSGIDLTEDSKISHLAGVMARAAMLIYWQKHGIGIDDRVSVSDSTVKKQTEQSSQKENNSLPSVDEIG